MNQKKYATLINDPNYLINKLNNLEAKNNRLTNQYISLAEIYTIAINDLTEVVFQRDVYKKALEQIKQDDEQIGHPCGPKEYGYFGTVANKAIMDGEKK